MVDALEATLTGWIASGFPELVGEPAALARVVRGQVFSLVVEHLALGEVSDAMARERAGELALLVFP